VKVWEVRGSRSSRSSDIIPKIIRPFSAPRSVRPTHSNAHLDVISMVGRRESALPMMSVISITGRRDSILPVTSSRPSPVPSNRPSPTPSVLPRRPSECPSHTSQDSLLKKEKEHTSDTIRPGLSKEYIANALANLIEEVVANEDEIEYYMRLYTTAVTSFIAGSFEDCIARLEFYSTWDKNDKACKDLLETAIQQSAKAKLGLEWDGVITIEHK